MRSLLKGLVLPAGAMLMTSLSATTSRAATSGDEAAPPPVSLLDTEPEVYYEIKRYPKYYDDPHMDRNMVDGSILGRQYIFGSFDGVRDKLAEHGLVLDAGVTQVGQTGAAGEGDGGRFAGSGDLWAVLDTGRARLWRGGLLFAHLEGDWGKFLKGTGALLPLNADSIMPAMPTSVALSELYLYQALPAGFTSIAGKVDWMAYADRTLFADEERTQFLYEGLVHNPVLRPFLPYTSLGWGAMKDFSQRLTTSAILLSNNDSALDSGVTKFGFNAVTYGVFGTWTPTFGSLPGRYEALFGYSTKSIRKFDVDERYFVDEIAALLPSIREGNNYVLALNASQYLWVNESAHRDDGLPVGFGPFFRFGVVPDDRNVIERFYSFGIGGNGGIFGRANDNWGIGWAGTQFSDDFRRGAARLGFKLDTFENAVEAYYNFALTPAVKTSVHAQYIDSANPSNDDALVFAMRLQVDF